MNTHHHRTIALTFERKAVFGVAALGVLCALLYTYCMGFSILHTAEREGLTREAESLQEQVADLERVYLSHSTELSPEVARAHGFVAVATPTYITRGSLSFNNSR